METDSRFRFAQCAERCGRVLGGGKKTRERKLTLVSDLFNKNDPTSTYRRKHMINTNPFARDRDSFNLTEQMRLWKADSSKAQRLRAAAVEIDRHTARPTAPTVQEITQALVAEVRRLAASGGADEGALRNVSRSMGATDDQHRKALRRLATVAGRCRTGRWLPHHYVDGLSRC